MYFPQNPYLQRAAAYLVLVSLRISAFTGRETEIIRAPRSDDMPTHQIPTIPYTV